MACDNCIGLLVVSIVCLLIAIHLIFKYRADKNKYTLYLTVFFLMGFIAWFLWFLSTEWVFNVFDSIKLFLQTLSLIAQTVLLLFVFDVFEVKKALRIVAVVLVALSAIFHQFYYDLHILIYVSTIIIILNCILFYLNWRRNEDIKSLGFLISLIFLLIGEGAGPFVPIIQGIFLIIVAAVWAVTFSGLLEKMVTK